MALLVGMSHFQLLQSPNSYYLGDTYDGFRTMMAAQYHVKYDSSYHHFEGMHYPYGDRLSFVDAQPLLTNSLKFISQHFTDISYSVPGVMNMALLISLWLSGLLLFLLLRKLELSLWYSLLVASGITFLSPQLARFDGHYGLAYTFAVPLLLYLLYRFEESQSIKSGIWWSLVIGGSMWCITQLHNYLFALLFFTVALYFLLRLSIQNDRHYFKKWLTGFGIQLLLPLAVLLISQSFDVVADRTARPFGFLVYEGHIDTIFISPDFLSGRWIRSCLPFRLPYLTFESYAYVGMVVSIFLIWELIRLIKTRTIKNAYTYCSNIQKRYLLAVFGAATILLLAALGMPFKIPGLEFLIDYLGPLRQFRSLGRFAWMFFYVANISVFYLLYQQSHRISNSKLRSIILILALGILGLEAIAFTFKKRTELISRPENRVEFMRSDNPWFDSIKFDQYQAILPIPFYHGGSENIWIPSRGKVMHYSLWASLETGLPVMASFMGRTSLAQTINQVEFIGEPYRIPQILNDLPNDKPILLMVINKNYKQVKHRFDHLLYGLKPIYADEKLRFYKLTISKIKERIAWRHKKFLNELTTMKLVEHPHLWSIDSSVNYIYKNFDEQDSQRSYRGGGAFEAEGGTVNPLYSGTIPKQRANARYVFSLWYFVNQDMHPKTVVHFKEIDTTTKKVIADKTYQLSAYIRSIDDGWALTDIPITIQQEDSQIQLLLENDDLKGEVFWVDEFQFRPSKARLFKKTTTEFARNNRWFEY